MENPIKYHLQRKRVVRRELSELLIRRQDEDVERLLDALLRLYGMPSGLIAVRDGGLEAITYQHNVRGNSGRDTIRSNSIRPNGIVRRGDRLAEAVTPVEWLEEHHDDLDWIRHDLREDLED
ncbi:hypothetical protein C479_11300 [Halovivax asiaticus JCM 14624]|uniref:Uncharacterized protein n=1 Tax=Halovivax asiaticus JCM 14624 TaxID=1227490 RepID=M0BG18_9EURY|nr:hypothetical protein [Halovivax asiaticus]ELZ09402.1 hypothetical protein C479_11300 [Halovivax asiaticus JCM 14624]